MEPSAARDSHARKDVRVSTPPCRAVVPGDWPVVFPASGITVAECPRSVGIRRPPGEPSGPDCGPKGPARGASHGAAADRRGAGCRAGG